MLPLLHAMLITGLGVIPAPTPTSEHTRESHEDTDGEVSATTLEDWIQPKVRLQAWHVTGTDEAVPIELPRVRFGLKGSPRGWVNYKLQLALEDDFEVKDAEVIFTLMPETISISIGRRKLPTHREFITSSGKLALVERSILHDLFDGDRGNGVALQGDRVRGTGWSYVIGGWTDEMGRDDFQQRANPTSGSLEQGTFLLALGSRVSFGNSKPGRFDQVDVSGGALRWDVGTSLMHSVANQAASAPGRTRGAIDAWLGVEHFSFVSGVHVARQQGSGARLDGFGAQQTVSYAWRGWLIPAARGAVFLPSGDTPHQHELTIGFNILSPRRAHGLKLALDASTLSEGQRRARAMVQVAL